jgi:hypothetical protein
VARPAEGRLGAPAAYVLPTPRQLAPREHPLTSLAVRSRRLADAAGFDILAARARDAVRFDRRDGPAWGLAPEHRPEVLVVARIAYGGRRPLDRFVAIPRQPWPMAQAVDLLLQGAGPVVHQEVVTCYGEVVRADLLDVIPTRFLDAGPAGGDGFDRSGCSDGAVLRGHLLPRRAVPPIAPELFTWSSAFNSARDLWPGVDGFDQLTCLTGEQTREIANHFLEYGLEALAAEAEHPGIRAAASRLAELCDWGLIDLHLTSQPYDALRDLAPAQAGMLERLLPEEHGLAYLHATPAGQSGRVGLPGLPGQGEARKGVLVVSAQWIAAALRREIVALVHLVRAASFARDDSFGKLTGSVWGQSAARSAGYEIPLFDVAVDRADGLAARFLAEALQFDNRVYGLQVQRDDYCRSIERRPYRVSWYPDPPARR